jgi:hypothetical protein
VKRYARVRGRRSLGRWAVKSNGSSHYRNEFCYPARSNEGREKQ